MFNMLMLDYLNYFKCHNYLKIKWQRKGIFYFLFFSEKKKKNKLLCLKRPFDRFGKYGLGKCRTYQDFISFTGVDPIHHIAANGSQCGNLTRV